MTDRARGLEWRLQLTDPKHFAAAGDPAGRAWIAGLPDLIDAICRRWGLELEGGRARHGYDSVVIPVRRRGEPLALKVKWRGGQDDEEVRALRVWDGRGAVRLHDVDPDAGAVLLERLDAERSLREIEIGPAAGIAGQLLRRLAVPAPAGFRDVRTLVGGTARSLEAARGRPGCPVPRAWLEHAVMLARRLAGDARTDLLIHADLHYDNILAGEREPWLAIDPSPVAGEPEQAVPELLWTRLEDIEAAGGVERALQMLVESAGLDATRAREWAIVRSVDYWLWGLEHGLTIDPDRCRRIEEALM